MDQANNRSALNTPQASEAQPWTAPKIVRMRAGDAEIGGNPNRPEGPIAFGS
jgi:hypothetical protein